MITWKDVNSETTTEVSLHVRTDCTVNVNINVGGQDPCLLFRNIVVTAHMNSMENIIALPHVMEALRHYFPNSKFILDMPYVPYARQDRRCNPGEAVGIKVFADQINAMGFVSVMIADPHSLVTPAVINNCQYYAPEEYFGHLNFADYIIVAPDLGALKKVEQFAKHVGARGVVSFNKRRNMQTGEIVSQDLLSMSNLIIGEGEKFLVLDDICDGGRTFVGVAEQLKVFSPAKLELAVTHGIFSYGVKVLTDVYDKIYTTNSFRGKYSLKHPKVEIIEV